MDIETSPILAHVWGLFDQNVGLNQIVEDWSVLAWAAKWLGEPASKAMYMDTRGQKNIRDDRKILKELWNLLDEADIVITQNGKRFDGPKLNSRFMLLGMMPPSPYQHLDTYQIVKRVAEFTSNKLEYLTDKFCVKYKKLSHKRFPGMSLWNECLKDNKDAWNEMKEYNIHDVLSTEELYDKIKAWAPQTMPSVHIGDNGKCGTCGKTTLQKRGYSYTKMYKVQRFQCTSCGSWMAGKKELQS
jgi:DNA-directed RNA polymerase subunit RPC12/RpoP